MDSMLIQAGSGLAGEADASSAGVPKGVSQDTLIVELGDIEAVKECFKREGKDIACIVIEPLPANNGLMPQDVKFLKALREICNQYGALLIFDEVISGFRVAFGGMAEKTGITPDIVTYGKVIGGGLPVGALAAKSKIMNHLAPVGLVYQAGTLSANPLAMVGGLANVRQCTPELYENLRNQTKKIVNIFRKWLDEFSQGQYKEYKIVQEESLFWFVPGQEPKNIKQMPKNLAQNFHALFQELLERGIYLSPNAYEIGFVSRAHDDELLKELERRLWN
jgi:glutamate-1-semialdehyde 2,1-aminomutase